MLAAVLFISLSALPMDAAPPSAGDRSGLHLAALAPPPGSAAPKAPAAPDVGPGGSSTPNSAAAPSPDSEWRKGKSEECKKRPKPKGCK